MSRTFTSRQERCLSAILLCSHVQAQGLYTLNSPQIFQQGPSYEYSSGSLEEEDYQPYSSRIMAKLSRTLR